MYWFSGLNNHNKQLYYEYVKLYTFAVITAKNTNPNIKPYLILDGEIDEDIKYLIDLGVNVITHSVTFSEDLKKHYKNDTVALGAFLRVDIPKICEKLEIKDDYVLYTDNDVYFVDDVSSLTNYNPKFFSACGEFSPKLSTGNMNSGVMWINWRNMLQDYPNFLEYIKNNFSKFRVYDQDALKQFYVNRIDELDQSFNYRPYWSKNDNIKIMHFHGPKPTYSDDRIKNYHIPRLVTPFYMELRKTFNEILKNYNK